MLPSEIIFIHYAFKLQNQGLILLKEMNVFLGCVKIIEMGPQMSNIHEDLSTHRESADVIVIAPVNSEVGPELKSNPLEMQRESPPRRSAARRVICQRGAERDLENKMRCGASVYDVLSSPEWQIRRLEEDSSHKWW